VSGMYGERVSGLSPDRPTYRMRSGVRSSLVLIPRNTTLYTDIFARWRLILRSLNIELSSSGLSFPAAGEHCCCVVPIQICKMAHWLRAPSEQTSRRWPRLAC
jgi:hypothetical protein